MSEKNLLPHIDFLGIGAPRCGTTWIAQCLSEHPDICMSKKKEAGILSENGKPFTKSRFIRNFGHCEESQIRGSFPVLYFQNEKFLRSIAKHYPNIRLLIILRNPTERAFSQFYAKKNVGKTRKKDFGQVLDDPNHWIIYESRYRKHLETCLSLFSKEQLFVGIYEDIEKDPVAFMRNIYAFLGVDDAFSPASAHAYINQSAEVKSKSLFLATLVERAKRYKQKLRRATTNPTLQKLWRFLGIGKILHVLEKKNRISSTLTTTRETRPAIDPLFHEKGFQIFKNDIHYLEDFLDRNLKDVWY